MYVDSLFNYERRRTRAVRIGHLELGVDAPVRIQSMANTDTNDVEQSVAQAERVAAVGGELVRFTTQGVREAQSIGLIHSALRAGGCQVPLVADVHFNPHVAEAAAAVVEKVRINPGNFVAGKQGDYSAADEAAELEKIRAKLRPLLDICKLHHTVLRIGVNHGSLSPRIMNKYGDTPEGLAASCMEFLRLCEAEHFHDIVLSVKASNTLVMVQAVRRLVADMAQADMHYPLHLGVTEAGAGEDGRIKSAVGIGALLADGIGDTVRVSLSEAPEAEIPVARKLVDYITRGHKPCDRHARAEKVVYDCVHFRFQSEFFFEFLCVLFEYGRKRYAGYEVYFFAEIHSRGFRKAVLEIVFPVGDKSHAVFDLRIVLVFRLGRYRLPGNQQHLVGGENKTRALPLQH